MYPVSLSYMLCFVFLCLCVCSSYACLSYIYRDYISVYVYIIIVLSRLCADCLVYLGFVYASVFSCSVHCLLLCMHRHPVLDVVRSFGPSTYYD